MSNADQSGGTNQAIAQTSQQTDAQQRPAPQQEERPTFQRRERRGGGGPRGRGRRRRPCIFCQDKIDKIDYKDIGRLRTVISDRGKIDPRRKTGCPANIQRQIAVAVKRARHMALLPYTIHQAEETGIFRIRD
jgi:small subunit ribosomal protein S18